MDAQILVIEDNADNIALVDYVLRAHGHVPQLARSGPEGIEIARRELPELILLDIRMPDMDGYEVVAELRREPALEHTRIVAVTASAMVGDRERITASGFDGYIQKPIDPETFIRDVERFLSHQPHGVPAPRRP
ncbi:MAG: response regulator [Solirubrobacteraceae bacterium]